MADPVTLGGAGLAMSGASGGIGAFGSIMSGQASSDAYAYKAAVAEINAKIALQNSDYAYKSGEVNAQQSGMKTRQAVGDMRATGGASGLDVNTGSKRAAVVSTQDIGEQNQAVVRANAAKQAYGYQVEAMSQTANAQVARSAGANALTAGYIGAGSSILAAAGSVASKWSQGMASGVFSSGAAGTGTPNVFGVAGGATSSEDVIY